MRTQPLIRFGKRINLWLVLALTLCLAWSPAALAKDSAAGSHMIKQRVGDFEPGTVITVCWRKVPPGNPFTASGPFNCQSTIKALKAPFPGGAVNGDQLMAVVRQALGNVKIKEVRVRALQAGKDAADPGANMMSVSPGKSEFYNNYVGREASGRLVLFLDIEMAQ